MWCWLSQSYESLTKEKEADVAAASTPELRTVKMVLASMKKVRVPLFRAVAGLHRKLACTPAGANGPPTALRTRSPLAASTTSPSLGIAEPNPPLHTTTTTQTLQAGDAAHEEL